MINLGILLNMQEILKAAPQTPTRDIAHRLIEEIHELKVCLMDLKGDKSCFCSMPMVHSNACRVGNNWLDSLIDD